MKGAFGGHSWSGAGDLSRRECFSENALRRSLEIYSSLIHPRFLGSHQLQVRIGPTARNMPRTASDPPDERAGLPNRASRRRTTAMSSPGAHGSPLRENQVGMFGDGASVPPTPPTNIRNLIAQKEKVRLVAPLAPPPERFGIIHFRVPSD